MGEGCSTTAAMWGTPITARVCWRTSPSWWRRPSTPRSARFESRPRSCAGSEHRFPIAARTAPSARRTARGSWTAPPTSWRTCCTRDGCSRVTSRGGALLALLLGFLALSHAEARATAAADSSEDRPLYRLDQVNVTALRIPTTARESRAAITLLSAWHLSADPTGTLDGALR